jgi:hypothetical protein
LVALPKDHVWGPDWALLDRAAWHPQLGNTSVHLPPNIHDAAAFLYRTKAEAEVHARIGGTCFLVGHPVFDGGRPTPFCIPYLVTNRHVALSAPVVRLNRRDGGLPDVFEKDASEWICHPDGDDVAVTPLVGQISETIHKISFGYTHWFISEEMVKSLEIGLGEEVFMIGRFINHQGRIHNSPAARFGSISVMPEPIWNSAILKDQLSYAVEMRSRTGFSGSMVVVYRTPATVLDAVKVPDFFGILGVNWGYINDENGENTWLNGVVPAWKITDIFSTKAIQDFHSDATVTLLTLIKRGDTSSAIPAIALPHRPGAENAADGPKERFTRLLGAAAKSNRSDGQTSRDEIPENSGGKKTR